MVSPPGQYPPDGAARRWGITVRQAASSSTVISVHVRTWEVACPSSGSTGGGALLYGLYRRDNKYTAALPGGHGYNVLQEDPEDPAFLVDGWEYYPGELLDPADFRAGRTPDAYTYAGSTRTSPTAGEAPGGP